MMSVCVVAGNVSDGFCIYGPFECEQEAVRWAGIALDNSDPWNTAPIFSPEDEEE